MPENSEDETDEDDEDDYVDNLPEIIQNKKGRGPRTSVSSEAFGSWNKKEAFEANVIPKSQEAKDKIYQKLN